MSGSDDRRRYTRCSFCGKGQDQVRKLVAGPGVYICDLCIDLCQEVLEEDNRSGGNKKAKSGFIPGGHGGVYAATTQHQLRQTMRNLLDDLEEAGMEFSQVVATNVYLDNLADFPAFREVYGQYFGPVMPASTVVQQIPPAERKADRDDHYPDLEQVSLIAVRGTSAH